MKNPVRTVTNGRILWIVDLREECWAETRARNRRDAIREARRMIREQRESDEAFDSFVEYVHEIGVATREILVPALGSLKTAMMTFGGALRELPYQVAIGGPDDE